MKAPVMTMMIFDLVSSDTDDDYDGDDDDDDADRDDGDNVKSSDSSFSGPGVTHTVVVSAQCLSRSYNPCHQQSCFRYNTLHI